MSFFDHLPPTLKEIAEVIGLDDMITLARAKGGTSIYVPAFCGEDHWLVELLGKVSADKLCAHYRVMPDNRGVGAEVRLPIWGTSAIDQARAIAYAALAEAEAEGASGTECVRRSGLSLRTVRRHRARNREIGVQPEPPLLAFLDQDESQTG